MMGGTVEKGITSGPMDTVFGPKETKTTRKPFVEIITVLAPTEPPTTTTEAPTTPSTTTTTAIPPWQINNCTIKSIPKKFANQILYNMTTKIREATERVCEKDTKSTCLLNVKVEETIKCMLMYPGLKDQATRALVIKQDSPIRQIPSWKGEKDSKLTVNVTMIIQSISDFSDSDQQVTILYGMIIYWIADEQFCAGHVKRLCAQGLDFHQKPLKITPDLFDLVWIPDLYPVDGVYEKAQADAMNPGKPLKYIRIKRVIERRGERKVTNCGMKMVTFAENRFQCQFDFSRYPNDIQTCNLTFRSLRFTNKEFKLRWNLNKMGEEDLFFTDFTTGEHRVTATPHTGTLTIGREEFDTIVVTFTFDRILTKMFINVYLPTSLQVLSSISTFWLPVESTSDRVVMASTCIIGLIQVFIEARLELPPSNSVSMMEIWLVTCVIFVTLQIFQAVIVKFILIKKQHEHERDDENDDLNYSDIGAFSQRDLQRVRQNRLYWMMYGIKPNDSYYGRRIIRQNMQGMNDGSKRKKKSRKNYFARLADAIFMTDLPYGKPEYLPTLIDLYSRIWFLVAFVVFVTIYMSLL